MAHVGVIYTPESSTVLSAWYIDNVFHVEYRKTGEHAYYGVTEEEFNSLKKAESIGKAIRELVKNKEYKKII